MTLCLTFYLKLFLLEAESRVICSSRRRHYCNHSQVLIVVVFLTLFVVFCRAQGLLCVCSSAQPLD